MSNMDLTMDNVSSTKSKTSYMLAYISIVCLKLMPVASVVTSLIGLFMILINKSDDRKCDRVHIMVCVICLLAGIYFMIGQINYYMNYEEYMQFYAKVIKYILGY
jgi:hypothetical protein